MRKKKSNGALVGANPNVESNLKSQKTEERNKALITLEKAKKLNRPVRILPMGMSGEELRKLKKIK